MQKQGQGPGPIVSYCVPIPVQCSVNKPLENVLFGHKVLCEKCRTAFVSTPDRKCEIVPAKPVATLSILIQSKFRCNHVLALTELAISETQSLFTRNVFYCHQNNGQNGSVAHSVHDSQSPLAQF